MSQPFPQPAKTSDPPRDEGRSIRIWLDCTSLRRWDRDHLTGIQRSVVGIYQGWLSLGLEVRLFVLEAESQGFRVIDRQDLPEVVRRTLGFSSGSIEGSGKGAAAPPDPIHHPKPGQRPEPGSQPTRRWQRLLGSGAEATALQQALNNFNLSRWQLQRAALRWLRSQWKRERYSKNPLGASNSHQAGAQMMQQDVMLTSILPGDCIFSIGSECYEHPQQLQAYQHLAQRGGKLIRMIYDMIPSSQPHWVYAATTKVFEEAAIQLIRDSHHLLTISKHSKNDILRFAEHHNLQTPPISVIRLGDQLEPGNERDTSTQPPEIIPTRPFWLCLGTVEPRKNYRLLQQTWRILATREPLLCPDLVCIGSHDTREAQLLHEIRHDPLINQRIYLLDQINDRHLSWYFDHCLATIFPSFAEGWGLPVAESLARGKLCLASRSSSIPEISEYSILFDPLDPTSLADLIQQTQADEKARKEKEAMIANGYAITEWSHTSRQILDATIAPGRLSPLANN